jgi:hypothetical protein
MPAFEVAAAAPAVQANPVAQPVHANPVVMPSVHANPLMPPVNTGPAEVPVHTSPVVMPSVRANPFMPAAQADPVDVPVDESPSAPPVESNPFAKSMHANPFAAPPAQAHPFMPPAQATRAEAPKASAVAPTVQAGRVEAPKASAVAPTVQAGRAEAPAHASPIAPVQASPIEAPAHASPIAPVQASPIAPSVQASLVEVPAHASPVASPAFTGRSERATYVSPVVHAEEDFNPIVRPVVEERVHTSPAPPPAVEPALANAAPSSVVESAIAEEPVGVDAPTAKEPSAPSETSNAPVEATSAVETPIAEEPVAALASSETPLEASSAVDTPTANESAPSETSDAPVEASSAVETPVVEEPVAEEPAEAAGAEESTADEPAFRTRVQPNAFETAPTEVAHSETPITQSELAAASADSVVGEAEIEEQAAVAQPYPPARSFTASGSEMPVVLTTPPPYRPDLGAPASKLFDLGREYLPRAQAWSQKTLRTTPRALVIAAPLVALLGIWAIRSAVSHPKQTQVVTATPEVEAQVAAAKPAPEAHTAETAAAAPILVATSAAPPAAPPAAEPAELASAISHGLPALEALAQKFPKDPQVGIALASQQAQAQRFEAAVESLERVISVDAKSAQNGKVMGILWRSAQSSASEPSFLALRKLGARGADIAFDLATTSGVRDSVRERAKTELEKSLSSEASADTRVASALLLAPDCTARKSLLARAEREGGKRTLSMLERFSRGSACTSSADKACNSCLTGSAELTHALAQLGSGAQK